MAKSRNAPTSSFVKLGKSITETLQALHEALGENFSSWRSINVSVEVSVEDERSGRPNTTKAIENA
jgi:hypothetical protein